MMTFDFATFKDAKTGELTLVSCDAVKHVAEVKDAETPYCEVTLLHDCKVEVAGTYYETLHAFESGSFEVEVDTVEYATATGAETVGAGFIMTIVPDGSGAVIYTTDDEMRVSTDSVTTLFGRWAEVLPV